MPEVALLGRVVLCAFLTLSPTPICGQILPSGELDPTRLSLAEKELADLLAPVERRGISAGICRSFN